MLYEMAAIYTDWYIADLETTLADHADALYDKLHKLNPNHAEGYIKRAQLYLAAGTKLRRADTLRTAIACLDKAKSITGKEALEVGTLRAEIGRAQKALEKPAAP
jgi:tetratricopeptide (TPR) repeat protein